PARDVKESDASLPAAVPNTVRLLTYNMLGTATFEKPAAFGRLLRALKPDILLLQEWPRGASASEGWFRESVDTSVKWHAEAGHDVAVISRFDLSPVFAEDEIGKPRALAGRVETPLGPLLVVSTHLKCCGGPDGREEKQRQREARSINDRLRQLSKD